MGKQLSFVKAVKDFFESEPFGRKVEIAEFRALTPDDRNDLESMLTNEGYTIVPLEKS
jgi:hypothetical protein